jgi:hypothetical protein
LQLYDDQHRFALIGQDHHDCFGFWHISTIKKRQPGSCCVPLVCVLIFCGFRTLFAIIIGALSPSIFTQQDGMQSVGNLNNEDVEVAATGNRCVLCFLRSLRPICHEQMGRKHRQDGSENKNERQKHGGSGKEHTARGKTKMSGVGRNGVSDVTSLGWSGVTWGASGVEWGGMGSGGGYSEGSPRSRVIAGIARDRKPAGHRQECLRHTSCRRRGRLRSTKIWSHKIWLLHKAQPEVRVNRFDGHPRTSTFRPKVNGWD